MCHLAGYIGEENCVSFILQSLKIQEPLIGAQATGLALLKDDGIIIEKNVGSVNFFKETMKIEQAKMGIGHTRYSIKNLTSVETNTPAKAHPFWNSDKTFATMHNGTISNFMDFVVDLEKKNYSFKSRSKYYDENTQNELIDYCDSEVFSFLLEEELRKKIEIKEAIRNACKNIKGEFAFVVLHSNHPDEIFIANWMQPLFIAFSKNATFFSSYEIGFEPIEKIMPWKIEPSKNVLITLKRGQVIIEPLLEERKIPQFIPNEQKLRKLIIESLKIGYNDIAGIWRYLQMNPEKIDLKKDDLEQLTSVSGFTFSPYIYSNLMKMEKEKSVERNLELVLEGGIKRTPRFKYYFKD